MSDELVLVPDARPEAAMLDLGGEEAEE